jgi:hypothetical protein
MPHYIGARVVLQLRVEGEIATLDVRLDQLLCDFKSKDEAIAKLKSFGQMFNDHFTTLKTVKR